MMLAVSTRVGEAVYGVIAPVVLVLIYVVLCAAVTVVRRRRQARWLNR